MRVDKKTLIKFCEKHSEEEFFVPKNELIYTLWKPGEIEKLNLAYKTEEFIPGFIGFGTDGGDELLSVNLKDGKVYSVPFIPMEIKEAVEIARDVNEFLTFRKK